MVKYMWTNRPRVLIHASKEDITGPQENRFNYHDYFRYVIDSHIQQNLIQDEEIEAAPSTKELALGHKQFRRLKGTKGGHCVVCEKWTSKKGVIKPRFQQLCLRLRILCPG